MAQSLITSDELLVKIRKIFPEISSEVITYTISTLIDIGALWLIDVDTDGSNIKKILLAPLGLELWRRIDEGILFNQQQVSNQYIKQIFNQDLLLAVLGAEREAWFELNQERIAAPKRTVNSQAVCLGLYLLLNGAIAREHALHLTRTDNKDFQWHDTLAKGLNIVAKSFLRKLYLQYHLSRMIYNVEVN